MLNDIKNLKALGVQHIGIELIINNDSSYSPMIENSSVFLDVLNKLQKHGFKIHILLSKWNNQAIEVPDSLLLKWNFQYQSLIKKYWNLVLSYANVQTFVYAVDFENIEKKAELYQNFICDLQQQSKQITLVYASNLNNTLNCKLHPYSQKVGIFYEHDPKDQHKKLARKIHSMLSNQFRDKKILITHANIQGQDALLQLKNLLRFWSNHNLSLVNINSIYNQTVISRENNYFSLKNQPDFLNYVKDYLKFSSDFTK